MAQSPGGSERERTYLDAVRAMYEGYQNTPGAVRWDRYLAAMDAIQKKYPGDGNASLFYALGLVWTAGPGEEGLAQRRKALGILLPIFKEHPDNPGAAHYIIHAADTPELAAIALPAAHRYAAIAPDLPHALHMPSHIFNRIGDWPDSIRANLASARVAADWIREGRGGMFDIPGSLAIMRDPSPGRSDLLNQPPDDCAEMQHPRRLRCDYDRSPWLCTWHGPPARSGTQRCQSRVSAKQSQRNW